MNARKQRSELPMTLALGALTALLALAGCGKSADEKAAEALAPTKVTKKPGAGPESKPEDRMANAVVSGKTTAPVELKYDLAAKPDVGQPIEITLAFQPRLPADTLQVEVSAVPGLTLVSAGAPKFQKVVSDQTYTSKVLVQASQPGVYYVNVLARMITQVQSEVRTFSVPVVVGTVPVVAEKPAPKTDASGQPIESMPAAKDR